MLRTTTVFLASLAVVGCDPDAAVFVEPTITSSSVSVTTSGLVTGLSGAIALNLHLGPRASGPGEVTLQAVSLTNADRSVTLVEAVGALPAPAFPVSVPVDADVGVALTVSADENMLAADAATALCGSGALVYVVVLDDTLRGGTVTAAGDPVDPAGCP